MPNESDPVLEGDSEKVIGFAIGAPASLAAKGAAPNFQRVLSTRRDLLQAKKNLLEKAALVLPYLGGPFPGAYASSLDVRAESDRLGEAVQAIDVLSGKEGQLTHRALFTLVRSVPEHHFNEAQWKGAVAGAFPLGPSINRMDMMRLWRANLTGEGVRIGVIDTGMDETHPDLKGIPVVANFTGTKYPNGPKAGQLDNRGSHGTSVVSILHALAPKADIRVYKAINDRGVLRPEPLNDPQKIEAIKQALKQAAADGCSIVTMSLGGAPGHAMAEDSLSGTLRQLRDKGILFVHAAGNSGKETVQYPGYWPEAFAVGSVSYLGRQDRDSSRNDIVYEKDGKAKILTKPDALAYGVRVNAAHMGPSYKSLRDSYSKSSGSSLAAPHAAAAAALVLQESRNLGLGGLSPEATARLLRQTGTAPKEGPYGVSIVNPKAACQTLNIETGLAFFGLARN